MRGRLVMAPEGTSPRIDEIRRLIDAGVLKAVSVGFKALKYEALDPDDIWGGLRYLEQELVETSLVSVPANPNALAVAKQLQISAETQKLVFAEHGSRKRELRRRGLNGGHAETSRSAKPPNMIPIGQRITDTEARIVALRDKLTDALGKIDDDTATDEDRAVVDELNLRIEAETRTRDSLRAAEKSLALASAGEKSQDNPLPGGTGVVPWKGNGARPFALPAKKLQPIDYMWRGLAIAVLHHHHKGARLPLDLIKEHYGEDEATRAVFEGLVMRAATSPAMTSVSGWAQQLVQTVFGEFIEALYPVSIYPKLAAMGGSFSFGRAGIVSMPRRVPTPTIAGSFVGEGAPIPVRQGAFDSIQMTPKKMAVISTFTREISEHSTPAIEGLIRQQILDDTAISIDTVLIDNNAATTVRPAGLLNGVTLTPPTAGGTISALIGDIRALVGALIATTYGNIRAPAWLMNPVDVLAIELMQANSLPGVMPFKEEVARGTLLGYPIIQSTTVVQDTMILVDAADFITATGDDVRFDVSDQAVLHMEDTTPAAIGTVGTPPVVAAPARSLWQTDSIGIRMILPMNWALRRSGMVAYTNAMTWN